MQANPVEFIKNSSTEYTTAVLAHCIWYFSSPSVLEDILEALAGRVKRVCLAEWNLTATEPRSVPHLLAALTQTATECHDPHSLSNIRTVVSPDAVHTAAINAGLTLQKREAFTPIEGMMDGKWETDEVSSERYLTRIKSLTKDDRERAVVVAMRDSVLASLAALKERGEKVRTMDVCTFVYIV